MAEEIKPKVIKKAVTSDEFNILKDEVKSLSNGLAQIVDLLKEKATKQTVPEKKESVLQKVEKDLSEKPDAFPIPPKWRKIVDEVLGPDFGINVSYPDSGSGFLFKVVVPLTKSNASQSHKQFYKVDVRTKAMSPADGVDAIKQFCDKVKNNLKNNNK